MDIDNKVKFWIKGFPYIWVPGASWETSKRLYLLHFNATALFDDYNYVWNRGWIEHGGWKTPIAAKETTFSLLPLAGENCHPIRNYFLIYLGFPAKPKHIASESDLRIEGKSIHGDYTLRKFKYKIDILGWGKISVFPWLIGNNPDPKELEREIQYIRGEDSLRFKNLYEVQEKYKLSNKQMEQIHFEAMEQDLDKPRWIYPSYPLVQDEEGDSNYIYETLVGKRKVYKSAKIKYRMRR